MNQLDQQVSLLTDDLTIIIPAISDIQLALLKDWCRRNSWSDFQIVQFQFYAIPPGGYIPVPLPKAAFAESDKYQQVFDILWEIQFLERISRWDLNKAWIFIISCTPLLFVKNILKSLTAFANIPVVVYQLLDLSVIALIIITVAYFYTSLSSHLKCWQCKNKLKLASEFVNLLASLKVHHERSIHQH